MRLRRSVRWSCSEAKPCHVKLDSLMWLTDLQTGIIMKLLQIPVVLFHGGVFGNSECWLADIDQSLNPKTKNKKKKCVFVVFAWFHISQKYFSLCETLCDYDFYFFCSNYVHAAKYFCFKIFQNGASHLLSILHRKVFATCMNYKELNNISRKYKILIFFVSFEPIKQETQKICCQTGIRFYYFSHLAKYSQKFHFLYTEYCHGKLRDH